MMKRLASLPARALGPAVVCALILAGCGGAEVKVHKNINSGSYVRKDFNPYEVAVLPFTIVEEENSPEKPNAILREVFYTYFSYLGYADLPAAQVDRKLKDAGYTDPARIAGLSPETLKELLGVDAVVKGHVLAANNFTGGIYAETRIQARLQMIDLHTGETPWETEHSQRDQSSIASLTLAHIVQQQLENVKTQQAYYKVAEEFSINVLKEIPDPAGSRKTVIRPPVISRMQTNLQAGRALKPGNVLKVTLLGFPGLKASYDIGNWKTMLPLEEIRPGVYAGAYNVLPEDRVTDALIIGRLTDQRGLISKKVYKGATLTLEPLQNLTQVQYVDDSSKKF
ncbi:MAG: GNA1162 family protein [Nitrospinales bacterium]